MTLKELLKKGYGLNNPVIDKLAGYDLENYKIVADSKSYVLKVYSTEKDDLDLARAENRLLDYLGETLLGRFPQPIKNKWDDLLTPFQPESNGKQGRLLTFLDGQFLGEVEHSQELFRSFGTFLAEMDVQLQAYSCNDIKARRFKWDLQHLTLNQSYIKFIDNPADQKIAAYFFMKYREEVLPAMPGLRFQIIHGDANEWNTLTQGNRVSGLIDFGDICHSMLIGELAIALAYALLDKDDPLSWACEMISAYHRVLPLEEKELDLLYWLIAARLCTSVCNSAFERTQRPENTYIQISEKPAWNLLRKWIAISPVNARNQFRKAADFKTPVVKTTSSVLIERLQPLSPALSVSYNEPIYFENAAFQYMFDHSGNRYLDAYNNIPHVGHSHPVVVEAAQKQISSLNTNTRYLYDQLNEYAACLLQRFPEKLSKVYLVNSGSAATDLALRLARTFTGRKRVAALEHGYHGNTQSAIEISHYKFAGKGGNGATDNVVVLPIPDSYRGKYKGEAAGSSYATDAKKILSDSQDQLAGFIAEPIVGCGGQVPLSDGYLNEMYKYVRDIGGICISDEVQTGFGRMGSKFWGYELHDVEPDIVILGKPMGNGHPMGAVVTTDEIAEKFDNGMEFFSSFGGNPVSCAIGLSVLEVIQQEKLQLNAGEVGDYYLKRLLELQLKHTVIGDVRGTGLFIGVDFVTDRQTRNPHTELAQWIKNELRNNYILTGTDGPYNNVLKSKPPLCFSKENVDEVILVLDQLLTDYHGTVS